MSIKGLITCVALYLVLPFTSTLMGSVKELLVEAPVRKGCLMMGHAVLSATYMNRTGCATATSVSVSSTASARFEGHVMGCCEIIHKPFSL